MKWREKRERIKATQERTHRTVRSPFPPLPLQRLRAAVPVLASHTRTLHALSLLYGLAATDSREHAVPDVEDESMELGTGSGCRLGQSPCTEDIAVDSGSAESMELGTSSGCRLGQSPCADNAAMGSVSAESMKLGIEAHDQYTARHSSQTADKGSGDISGSEPKQPMRAENSMELGTGADQPPRLWMECWEEQEEEQEDKVRHNKAAQGFVNEESVTPAGMGLDEYLDLDADADLASLMKLRYNAVGALFCSQSHLYHFPLFSPYIFSLRRNSKLPFLFLWLA